MLLEKEVLALVLISWVTPAAASVFSCAKWE